MCPLHIFIMYMIKEEVLFWRLDIKNVLSALEGNTLSFKAVHTNVLEKINKQRPTDRNVWSVNCHPTPSTGVAVSGITIFLVA